MSLILKYEKEHELELISLMQKEPDWSSFLSKGAIDVFRNALLSSDTYICKENDIICGYLRALVDGFGVYVSELYIAPKFRGNSHGAALLAKIKEGHPYQDIYVLSDEDAYYEKLGVKRVGSVFQLQMANQAVVLTPLRAPRSTPCLTLTLAK